MSRVIPFGQPILVGHHSEKSDRAYRGRITNKFQKSFEESEKAKKLKGRAFAAENNTSISSDNPNAVELLKEKLVTIYNSYP